MLEIAFPQWEDFDMEEEIEDVCGDLEPGDSGTWLGSYPWARDMAFHGTDDQEISAAEAVREIFQKHSGRLGLYLVNCSAEIFDDEDEEDEPDDEPVDMSGPGNPSGDGR